MAILTIDQGTTGTTLLLVDRQGQVIRKSYHEFTQYYPQPGWVEHDAEEIWDTVTKGVAELLKNYQGPIEAIGITNQRETTVVWDSKTSKPVSPAIVWQCRRTTDICHGLEEHSDMIRERTGLPVDAYFSGTKLKWILNETASEDPTHLKFGTIDTWLIWKLTDGGVHATDYTNASRTMLFNIHELAWDPELCELLDIPLFILPDVRNSSGDFGQVSSIDRLNGVPITGVAGDQQASLYGQHCFKRGDLKNTYGTGCFIMMNTGDLPIHSEKGLITTLAANPLGEPCYALEGSVFVAGATIQWIRDELGLIQDASESEGLATELNDNGGVYLVPAFVGLGAPYWDMDARGILTGLTRGSGRSHIVRAALESMTYQTMDVIKVMEEETGKSIGSLSVDGGATANGFLMQFQADILGCPVARAEQLETTALGAAYLAGLAVGFWTLSDLKKLGGKANIFSPHMGEDERQKNLEGWRQAIRKVRCT